MRLMNTTTIFLRDDAISSRRLFADFPESCYNLMARVEQAPGRLVHLSDLRRDSCTLATGGSSSGPNQGRK
jgi:hypothetical protein